MIRRNIAPCWVWESLSLVWMVCGCCRLLQKPVRNKVMWRSILLTSITDPLCYRSAEHGPAQDSSTHTLFACSPTVSSLPHNTTGNTYHSDYLGRKYYFPLVALSCLQAAADWRTQFFTSYLRNRWEVIFPALEIFSSTTRHTVKN